MRKEGGGGGGRGRDDCTGKEGMEGTRMPLRVIAVANSK